MLHDQGTDSQPLSSLLSSMEGEQKLGGARVTRPFATGMDVLDQVLDGGVRPHDLTLLGGQPGVGKTIVTLQWARNMAAAGDTAIYVCYEHDHADLMARLMALELGTISEGESPSDVDKLKTALTQAANGVTSLSALIQMEPLARQVHERLREYADRLILVRGSGRYTTVPALEELAKQYDGMSTAMFVDYLQKIPIEGEAQNEAEKVTQTAEGLKELALNHDTAVVAVVAASNVGLESKRLRLHHLRGSSALAYESDVIILLNEKQRIVSKVHLAYDSVRAAQYQHNVIFSIEKNRHGTAMIDMEFRKDFSRYRFDPRGGFPNERLVDERLNEE